MKPAGDLFFLDKHQAEVGMSAGASQNQLSTRVGSSCPHSLVKETSRPRSGGPRGCRQCGGLRPKGTVHPRGKGVSGDQAPDILAYPEPSKFLCLRAWSWVDPNCTCYLSFPCLPFSCKMGITSNPGPLSGCGERACEGIFTQPASSPGLSLPLMLI